MVIAIGGVCWSMVSAVVLALCRSAALADAAAVAAARGGVAETPWRGVALSLGDPAPVGSDQQRERAARLAAMRGCVSSRSPAA
jgi:hypothetical protein